MEKYILYGAGKKGKQAFEEFGQDKIECFIDGNKNGEIYCGKKVISIQEYIDNNYDNKIIICVMKCKEIMEILEKNKVENFEVYNHLCMSKDVPLSESISHTNWIETLQNLSNKEGKYILEVGSRVVTGACYRDKFNKANYTGFDLYDGPNVDVVGDAHILSRYFDQKFDMIFSSAVFEHFAMPWMVADEMIKLLKPGGYIFVETHYSFSSHERPWHFFQFSEMALKVLFSENRGIKCIEAGCSNPINGEFSADAAPYLKYKCVEGLYCHSEFLGQKVKEVGDLSWNNNLNYDGIGMYPKMGDNYE